MKRTRGVTPQARIRPCIPRFKILENRISAPNSTNPIFMNNSVRIAGFTKSGTPTVLLINNPIINAQRTYSKPYVPIKDCLDITCEIKPSNENMKKLGIKYDKFPRIVLIATEKITIRIKVNIKYETKLSKVNELSGLISHEVGFGILLIIPEKPIQKRINPIQTAHQSSDFIKVTRVDFKEMVITNINRTTITIYYLSTFQPTIILWIIIN
jgi:hypothetical protein